MNYSLILLGLFIFPVSLAYGFGPNDPECYEEGTCDFFSAPLDTMLLPFETVFGDFVYVLIWGLIIGILWLRVSNTMVVGVIGIALAILFQPQFSDDSQVIGYVLLAMAVAVALYQILTIRTHFPSN